MKIVRSAHNRLFQHARQLLTTKYRRTHQAFLVRGARLVMIAARQQRLTTIFAPVTALQQWRTWAPRVQLVGLPPRLLAQFKTNAPAERAVVAIATMQPPAFRWGQRVLVLDGLQDPGNVGSLIRTAFQFGFANVCLTNHAVGAHHPLVVSGSQGAWFRVHVGTIAADQLRTHLRTHHYTIINTDLNAPATLQLSQLPQLPRPLAVILGAEGNGVSVNWRAQTCYNLHVIVRDAVLALNVAVTGAVIMHSVVSETLPRM